MSLLDQVDIHDAGEKVVITGDSCAVVSEILAQIKAEGAIVSKPVKVGNKWVGYFERPGLSECTATRNGFEVAICGPTSDAIQRKSEEYITRGAKVMIQPYHDGKQWVMYLSDDAARTGTMFVR